MDGAFASEMSLAVPAEAFVQWLCRLHRRRVRLRWNESSPRWSLFTWGAGSVGTGWGLQLSPMAKIKRDYLKRKLKHVGFVENLPLNRKGKEVISLPNISFQGLFLLNFRGVTRKHPPRTLGILNFWLLYMGVSLWPPRPNEKTPHSPRNLLKLLAGR